MTSRITLRDVARAAGVSPTTVSFVLNDTRGQTIPEQTRRRVREAASSLGYTPHRIARALREGASRLVLLETGPLRRAGTSLNSLILGLDDELRRHGYTLLVTSGGGDDELLHAVAPRTVLDLTSVYFGTSGGSVDDGGWVDGMAAHTATQLRHLVARGHSRLAVGVPADPEWTRLAELRVLHAQQFAAAEGLPPPVVVVVPHDKAEAARAVDGLRRAHPQITALAAFSDDVALAVLAGMTARGLQAPDDLAVIGFDESGYGELWEPALTTVVIDAEAFGRRAARAALGLDAGEWATPSSHVVSRASV
ncbi:MAG: LacI family DNA-binding transcriptional regulator [Microbacterium sp.]|uniref:LacI family DNA-binding transcriptional regulator n=1 Tax=Microbacterium sp. TaxID=51671 RepID=UPI0039E38E42